jgi:hypothetical protein
MNDRQTTKEALMYISHQELQAIHQDIVNDSLRRSEQRRLLKEMERDEGTRGTSWNPGTVLRTLVRSMIGVAVRP